MIFVAALALSARGRTQPVIVFPQRRPGEAFDYRISFHSERRVKTDGPVISSLPVDTAQVNVNALLHAEVLNAPTHGTQSLIRLKTHLSVLDSASALKIPNDEMPKAQVDDEENQGKSIEFTILRDGRVDSIVGLDKLVPEQQQTWQEWLSRFALAASLPLKGFRVRQRWSSEEAETSPSPLASLRWLRESTYVGDEPCGPVLQTAETGLATKETNELETCAVVMTTATLKSPPPRANQTPEAFKIHELHTSGTASGKNRIFTYISLKTGLMVRASEEADQQMDVTVSKADGSNRVRYKVTATSQSEVLMVKETPLVR